MTASISPTPIMNSLMPVGYLIATSLCSVDSGDILAWCESAILLLSDLEQSILVFFGGYGGLRIFLEADEQSVFR